MEAAAPYVYDRFVGVWGMFLHHDQVPLYFAKHIYAEFVLDMHLDYTSTKSEFFGAGRGGSYQRPGARRDLAFMPAPLRLVPILDMTVIRLVDVAQSSQMATEARHDIAESLFTAMGSAVVVVHGKASRPPPPPAPAQPEIEWVDDDLLRILDSKAIQGYAQLARDAYFRLYRRYITL